MYSRPQLLEAIEEQSKLNGIKVFEDIVDKDGHPRFIEGEGSVSSSRTDFVVNYNRWSLSGTHLMLVVGFTVANGDTFTGGRPFYFDLPQWIMDKITPVWGNYVDNQSINYYADDFTTQSGQCALEKRTDTRLSFYFHTGSITMTKKRSCRIVFDILVDNADESEE